MESFPKKEKLDHLHSSTKIALNVVPFVGGSLAELFDTVFTSPIDKRKEEWLNYIGSTLEDLCSRYEDITPESLSKSPEFVSAYMQASNIAIRTHHKEKLEALKSAVKNTLLLKDLDENKKLIFFRIIEQMSPLHFKVLHFINSPKKYVDILNKQDNSKSNPYVQTTTYYNSLTQVWDKSFPEVSSSDNLIDIVIGDLKGWGLSMIKDFHHNSSTDSSNTTRLGIEFIQFINNET